MYTIIPQSRKEITFLHNAENPLGYTSAIAVVVVVRNWMVSPLLEK